MRKPNRNSKEADDFVNSANDKDQDKYVPWEHNLSRKYDKTTGKTINVRLPEYYAECLQYLAEQDSRSQHSELVHLIKWAVDQAVINTKTKSK